jgi:thiol-disulfide isomerase/thioredoxin
MYSHRVWAVIVSLIAASACLSPTAHAGTATAGGNKSEVGVAPSIVLATQSGDDGQSTDGREAAPNFNVKTITGEKFTKDSLNGHVVLLQFWTTWCPYCRRDQPIVDELDREFRDQGLVVLAVDVNESKKTVKRYLEQNPRTCRIVLTEDTNLAAIYAATSYPIYVVIDSNGNIVATRRGSVGERALRYLLMRAGLSGEE